MVTPLHSHSINVTMSLDNKTSYSNKEWSDKIKLDKTLARDVKRKLRLNHIILNWLVTECHINALRAFGKDLGFDLDKYIDSLESEDKLQDDLNQDLSSYQLNNEFDNVGVSDSITVMPSEQEDTFFKDSEEIGDNTMMINNLRSIKVRHEIKMLILRGEISEVFQMINLNFPNLFEKNNLIYFKLLHLQLIEMIRSHVILKSQNVIDEPQEREFLDNIVEFVRNKLSNLKILSNKMFIKDLEMTMVLLCYTDELSKLYQFENDIIKVKIPLKLRNLFDKSQRIKISKLINKSIILDITNADDINLIRYDDEFNFNYENDLNNFENINEQDLILKFNKFNNIKLNSLIKLWIWSENKLSQNDIKFPKVNLNL